MSKQLPAKITIEELGKAMSQLDLSSVPKHKRHLAVIDHLMKIQEDTLKDREVAAKIGTIRRHVHKEANKASNTLILPSKH